MRLTSSRQATPRSYLSSQHSEAELERLLMPRQQCTSSVTRNYPGSCSTGAKEAQSRRREKRQFTRRSDRSCVPSSRAEGEYIRLQPGIVRDQRQHMLSTGHAAEQPYHSRSIEARHSVGVNVGASELADRFPVEHHSDRRFPGRSRVHHQVDLTRSEGKEDPARAVP